MLPSLTFGCLVFFIPPPPARVRTLNPRCRARVFRIRVSCDPYVLEFSGLTLGVDKGQPLWSVIAGSLHNKGARPGCLAGFWGFLRSHKQKLN